MLKLVLSCLVAVVALSTTTTVVSSTKLNTVTNFEKKNETILRSQSSVVATMAQVLCGAGFSAAGAAGVVGNAEQESSLNPRAIQYGGGPGRGLFQMSIGQLWSVNQQFCQENGLDYWSTEGQTRFVIATIQDPKWADRAYGTGTASYLNSCLRGGSVDSTTTCFEKSWERCGVCDTSNRVAYANQWYGTVRQYCGGAPNPPPSPPGPSPSGGCQTFYYGLCPGGANCMCTTGESCGWNGKPCIVNSTMKARATNKLGGCSGSCRNVIHGECPGSESCLKSSGSC